MTADILLVDDDAGAVQVLARILANEGNLRFATNGQDALRLAAQRTPDLVLLDAQMPGMDGFAVCSALKADSAFVDVPVIFVTSHRDERFEIAGFAAGAVDFIAKPVNPQLTLARVRSQLRIKRMADELRHNANVDALTGVANRRAFDRALEREWLRARRTQKPLSLLLVDIDHFKPFNDHYGHPAGDACLRTVASAIGSTCSRTGDVVARYGGEEFALILPETPLAGAERIAQRVLDAVQESAIAHEASPVAAHVTVSVGVACSEPLAVSRGARPSDRPQTQLQLLVQAADAALYSAKDFGRARSSSAATNANSSHQASPQTNDDSAASGSHPTQSSQKGPACGPTSVAQIR